ncbi:MAG TPA: FAD-binding oxidoreductase, partial [Beijerinckiaceae bacterium]|jgi:CDP-4-dehydro-6-deoxyglucose reductase
MMFVAGQHIEFMLPDDVRRTYSIATKPSIDGVTALELHIRHVPGGHFTQTLLPKLKERDLMKFKGPLGTFALDTANDKPIVLVAGGTGFAPIKAMVEHAIERGLHRRRPIAFYWGARTREGLYQIATPQGWTQEHPEIRFTPVVSDPTPACEWSGRVGLVHAAVLDDLPDLSGHDVYVCGAPAMVEAARADFAAAGLPDDAFHADAFLTRADAAAAA